MACVQIPTLTRTDVSTSESLFPTLSVFTSTGPSSLSTSTFRTCTQTNSSIPCRPTLTSSVVTLPGNVSLQTVSVTETIGVPITSLVTLFGSSCTTSSTPTTPTTPSSTPPVTSPSSSPTSDSTTSDQTTIIVSTSTPPPTLITSSTLVTSDGSTFVDVFTSTSSPPPTLVTTTGTSLSSSSKSTVPPTSTTTNLQINTTGTLLPNTEGGTHGSHKKSSNTGPVVGGVLGGIAILAVLGIVTWKLIKKQSRFDDIFNKTSNSKPHYHKAKTEDPEPKPYNYGLVGQGGPTNPMGVTHATPNPTGHGSGGNDIGHQAQATNAVSQQGQGTNAVGHSGQANTAHTSPGQTSHGANNVGQSGQATNNTVGQPGQTTNPVGHASQAANGIGQSGQGGNGIGQSAGQSVGYQPGNEIGAQSGQPSAAQHLSHLRNPSLTPLLGAVGVAAAAGAAGASMASSSRPSSSRPSSSGSSQPIGPLVSNAPPPSSYPPALQNWNTSQGYQAASNTQGYGSGPSMAGPSGLSQGAGSINSMASGSSGYASSWGAGPSSRSGAHAASFQPPLPGMIPLVATSMRRDNHNLSAQQYDDPFARTGSPVSIQEHRILQVTNAETSLSYRASGVYDPQAYFSGQGDLASSSGGAGPSSEGSQAGSSTDGKGRPLNLRGEKAALVHLDGGLYQEPSSEMSPPGPAPPAYNG